jgi:GAF domain-containing protein
VKDHELVEEHEAIAQVAGEVVPKEDLRGPAFEPSPARHGLTTFDEVAVVDHLTAEPRTVSASGPGLAEGVALEARLGQGPSIEAVSTGELVVCRDLEHERRWPAFTAAAIGGHLTLRRWVVVPLAVPGEDAIGSLVVASTEPGIVTPGELSLLGTLADRCSLSLTARLAAGREARAVLATDSVRLVGLAVGVLMATQGWCESRALARLRSRAEEDQVALAEAAVAVLTEHRMSFDRGAPRPAPTRRTRIHGAAAPRGEGITVRGGGAARNMPAGWLGTP